MRLLFVADLHYSLKQFDWLLEHAAAYDMVAIGGELVDLSSALDGDVQLSIVEMYRGLVHEKTQLVACSGNYDGDSRNAADDSVAGWLQAARGERMHVDGDGFDMGETRLTACPWWDGHLSRG